ncbi:hypothetical protein H072_1104 [Dactylellina haptotyla CBS 200.50]|uniref:Uncharacterized protein n=1 Tax=Dactylellina haptotyla (strain CBS 200.50) TaxID=1284197 RepID=S8AVC3_DACHA|nr:hypothetical protein H072_1104 [Dactylellina haptotyla CBS 200.50]
MSVEDQENKLKQLQNIRHRLDDLINDRDNYIKSSGIESIFHSLDTEAHIESSDLYRVNGDFVLPSKSADMSPKEILLLLSLSYMTIGKNNELPALYSNLVVIKILLHQLMNAGIYSRHDLATLEAKFDDIGHIIEQGKDKYSPTWLGFFRFQLDDCRRSLDPVAHNLDGLSPHLDSVYEKLVSLIRQITAVGSRPKVVISEIRELQEEMMKIEESRVDGNFVGPDGSIPEGQHFVSELLEKCHFISDSIVNNSLQVDPSFAELHKDLVDIKGKLERLRLTHVWSRETDLFTLLQQLRRIDGLRINDRFVGSNNTSPEEGQKV